MKDSLCCCVCLKDEPFENNPIVSCDGKNCTTVVHKACYGIQQIPDGAWFCQKCISQERTARVRCELCPSREGALKHTNKGGWCHIVCALFIPGAEFLDAARLETVSLDNVASDKLNKVCSICEKNNRLDRASVGACIQCIKSGCKTMFHVTCGQSQGLLTEIVSVKEGVRYVAYCCLHKQKSKRRDFTIRLSNSTNCPSSHDKNKLRQSPPQLEKSDEDCVTPQESSSSVICRSSPNKNLTFSSCSSNINLSSDSVSQGDSSAPEICTSFELREEKEKILDSNIPAKCQTIKSTEKLLPPNIAIEMQPTNRSYNLLPPNICYSDTGEVQTKEEATVKQNMFSSTRSDTSTGRNSKRQAANLSTDIPQKKEKILKSERKLKSNVSATGCPMKIEKIKKAKKISTVIKTKSETRTSKKGVAPSLPKSILSQMSSIIGGSPCSTSSASVPSTSSTLSTSKMSGTSCQSMEELLEWQWDQAGALLMQQAEASDIASLLSCLHDLKNENEQLLTKQLKLSHRRDHLKAINAKLQLQLMPKPSENLTNPPITNTPGIPNTDSRLSSVLQAIPRTLSKAPPSTPISQPVNPPPPSSLDHCTPIQYRPLSHGSQVTSDIVRPRPNTEGSSLYIQQPISMWSQSSSQPTQQRAVDQSLNQQTIALLKHYQQQQLQQQGMSTPISQSTGVSVSNLFSQTDLVALLNNSLHSQISGCNQSKPVTQDVHISPNNGTNMEFLYQALQQKSHHQQQQQQHQQQQHQQQQQQKYQTQPTLSFYQTTQKLPTQSGNGMNFESVLNQNPDNSPK